jgi:hypothetical protein
MVMMIAMVMVVHKDTLADAAVDDKRQQVVSCRLAGS